MVSVFEHPFEVVLVDEIPQAKDAPKAIVGHLEGCRRANKPLALGENKN